MWQTGTENCLRMINKMRGDITGNTVLVSWTSSQEKITKGVREKKGCVGRCSLGVWRRLLCRGICNVCVCLCVSVTVFWVCTASACGMGVCCLLCQCVCVAGVCAAYCVVVCAA